MLSRVGLILLVLCHSSGLANSLATITGPPDLSTLIGSVVTFQCNYNGSSPPHWDVYIPDQSNVLPTEPTESLIRDREETLPGGGYLNYTSTDNQMAMLEVLVTRASNGSEFQCEIFGSPDVRGARASLTVFGEPLPPSVTVEQYEYNFINVSWSVPWSSDLAPVLGYIVQLVGPGGSVDSVRNVTGSGRLTYTFDGLAFDTLYRVQVAAYNSVGQGVFAEVRQTTRIPDAPPPPTGLSRTITIIAQVPNITIFWEEPVLGLTQPNITSYTLNYKISNESSYMDETVMAPQTSVKVPEVVLGRSYNAFVTATNDGGQSNSSEVLTLTATYLQSVSFEQTTSGVRVSCEFAVSDQDLQCRVTISSGEGFTLSVTARVEVGSRPPVASVVTTDLPQEMLMFSAVAQRVSDGEAIEEFMATGNVSMIQDGGTSGRLLTDEQIFIIVGVVAGTFVLIVTLLSIIFVILGIRDRKNRARKHKRKPWKEPKENQYGKATVQLELRPSMDTTPDPAFMRTSEPDTGTTETFNC